jgi:hypothetical protein
VVPLPGDGRGHREPSPPSSAGSVFEELSPEDLLHAAEVAVPRSFEPHKVVFREGDDSDN